MLSPSLSSQSSVYCPWPSPDIILFLAAWVIMVASCFTLLILFLSHLKRTRSLPPRKSVECSFYFVAFPGEGFNASYLKIKHCPIPEPLPGCPQPPAILPALPVVLSGITCSSCPYPLAMICQPDSSLLHFIHLCSSLISFSLLF